jgi:hypothetical protein
MVGMEAISVRQLMAYGRCEPSIASARVVKGRIRRIGIVALARKLLAALWRYLETGLVPRGAVLRR